MESRWVEKCVWLPWGWIPKPQRWGGVLEFHAGLWESGPCELCPGSAGWVLSVWLQLPRFSLRLEGAMWFTKCCDVRSFFFFAPPLMPNSFGAFLEWVLTRVLGNVSGSLMCWSTFHPFLHLSSFLRCLFFGSLRPDFKSFLLQVLILMCRSAGSFSRIMQTYERPGQFKKTFHQSFFCWSLVHFLKARKINSRCQDKPLERQH